jgi:cytochrome c556
MRKASSIFAVVSLALVFAGLQLGRVGAEDAKKDAPKSDGAKGDDCYKFVAPLASIMKVVDGVFSKMPEKVKTGKFKDVKNEALFLAEVGNLATHVKEFRDKKEWQGFADAMKGSALKLADAADKKDEAAFKTLHAAVEKACDACHEKFRDN